MTNTLTVVIKCPCGVQEEFMDVSYDLALAEAMRRSWHSPFVTSNPLNARGQLEMMGECDECFTLEDY